MYENIHLNKPSSEEVVRIKGQMRGSIRCKRLLVPKGTEFFGSVVADEIQCHGRMEGTVIAKRFHASPTSEIHGSVTANIGSVKIDLGSNFHASIVTTMIVVDLFKQVTDQNIASNSEAILTSVSTADRLLPQQSQRTLSAENSKPISRALITRNAADLAPKKSVEVSTTPHNNAPIKAKLPFIFGD